MNQEIWAQALSYIIPNLATILTIVGVVINFLRKVKKNATDTTAEIDARIARIAKMENDVAITKAKAESIEKYLIDKEQK